MTTCAFILRSTWSLFTIRSLLPLAVVCAHLLAMTDVVAAERVPWSSGRVVGSPNPPAPYAVSRIHPQINIESPVDLCFAPDGGRLFVAEQGGKIWSFDPATPGASPSLAIDLRKHHRPFDNVLGFTFHPGFATNRFIFINYNEPGGRENGSFVSRFTLSAANPPTIDPASEQVILRWFSGGHNGCTLAFGPDGKLYISAGDSADPDPPDGKRRTGQDLSDFLASILRIDVDRADGTNAYSVPSDNPFVNTPGARPEVWAFGFRNPFRMSFDRATGDLWVGDVGWELWEMVYRVQRGGNYGWPINEGPNLNVRTDVRPGPGPILPPVHSVPHSDGASITGGQVYHGKRLPRLSGAYIYGDWETGKFWALRHENGRLISNDELCDSSLKPVSFALDPRGELVILDFTGGLYELTPNVAPAANESFPRKLTETGLFTSVAPLKPAPGTVTYSIAAPMWNDHATAEWLLAVPGPEPIVTAGGVGNITGGTWLFPTNTVLARTLTLELEDGNPSSSRRIETQLLHWDGQAWNPYSYRWRTNGSDADLVGNAGTNDTFAVRDPLVPGGIRETPWRFMSRAECLRCHNAWAGETLTLNWLQLGAKNTSGANRTALENLVAAGVVKVKVKPEQSAALVNPHDTSQPVTERARSWLHANCSACHRFGAGGAVAIHLNYDKPSNEWRAIDERPRRGEFGLDDARIIAAGAPYRSALFYRLFTEGSGHMPQIGSRLVDDVGARAVRDWIRSLPSSGSNRVPRSAGPEEIFAQTSGALRLLDLITEVPPGLARHPAELEKHRKVRDDFAARAAAQTNAMVRDLFQRLLPASQRRHTLGSDIQPQTILALTGDAARGRGVFEGVSQCSRCHVHSGAGRNFGPDLSAIGSRYSRAQLLEQILAPSKIIAPEFKTMVVILADDSEVSGFVVRQSATELLLRDESLAERRFNRSELKDTRESSLSTMPEGLLAPLTPQEAADLLEFLFASKASPAR